MALIQGIIPAQNNELIRDQIAAILALELAYQGDIDQTFTAPTEVFVERITAPDASELPMVNVMLATGVYSNKDQRQVDATYTFFVDFYTKSPYEDDMRADTLAGRKLHQLMGKARAILENPQYKTLEYRMPHPIRRVRVSRIDIIDGKLSQTAQDMHNTTVGRLQFVVDTVEGVELVERPLISSVWLKLITNDDPKRGYSIRRREE